MLAQRVAVAVVGIPVIFGLIWVGGWPFAIVVAIALAVAAAEFAHLRWLWLSFPPIIAALFVFVAMLATHRDGGLGIVIASAAAVAVVVLIVGVPSSGALLYRPWLWVAGALVYVGLLGSAFILVRDLDHGRDWAYLALFATFAVDTAAYFTGRAIGRHKMAPAISPKKTWEGFAGGCIGGFAAVVLLAYVLDLDVDAGPVLLIAATLPLAAAAGDLFESWIKRRAGVKDASALIPGHGGVLDRLDSLLFVFPLVWVVARWVA